MFHRKKSLRLHPVPQRVSGHYWRESVALFIASLSVLVLNPPFSTCQMVCSSRAPESLDLSNTEMVPGGQQDSSEKLRSAEKGQ
jgi:hypothetical protein